MQESWEVQWEDYYAILQVHPSAELEVIQGAYRRLVQKYHPDISKDPTATERMKKINIAYEVLSDTEKRERYHAEWIIRTREATGWQKAYAVEKPSPVVEPEHLFFRDVEPRQTKKASFILSNAGGPYERIRVWPSKPDSWVRVAGYFSLTDSDELPMRVEIEAEGEDWDETYSESITVKLDEEATEVKVRLQTKPEPARATVGSIPRTSGTTYTQTPVATGKRVIPNWLRWSTAIALMVLPAIIYGVWYGISQTTVDEEQRIRASLSSFCGQLTIPGVLFPYDDQIYGYGVMYVDSTIRGESAWAILQVQAAYKEYVVNPDTDVDYTYFIFHSPDGGSSWEMQWRSDLDESTRLWRLTNISCTEEELIAWYLEPPDYEVSSFIYSRDGGSRWANEGVPWNE